MARGSRLLHAAALLSGGNPLALGRASGNRLGNCGIGRVARLRAMPMKRKHVLSSRFGWLAAAVLLAAAGLWIVMRANRPPTSAPGSGQTEAGRSGGAVCRDEPEVVPGARLGAGRQLQPLAAKPSREELVREAVERYEQDPDKAVEWAQSLATPGERETALLAVVGELVRDRPRLALELAAELPQSAERDDTLERAAREWAGFEPEAAVAWAKQVADETLRLRLLGGAVLGWSQTQPVEAATLAINELPPGRRLDDLLVGIVQRWGQSEPEAAAAWVADFPESPLKDAAEASLAAIRAMQGR